MAKGYGSIYEENLFKSPYPNLSKNLLGDADTDITFHVHLPEKILCCVERLDPTPFSQMPLRNRGHIDEPVWSILWKRRRGRDV